jgi:DNA-binding response OmpR family regulator
VRYYLVKPFSNQVFVDAVLSLGSDINRLLVIDDDPAMVMLVTRALQSGVNDPSRIYKIETAPTGNEARKHLRENRPDAVLLDVTLPDISGLDLLAEIEHLDIPVIVITAHEWPQVLPVHEYEALRIQMRRPLNRNELPNVLKGLLEVIHPEYPSNVSGQVP